MLFIRSNGLKTIRSFTFSRNNFLKASNCRWLDVKFQSTIHTGDNTNEVKFGDGGFTANKLFESRIEQLEKIVSEGYLNQNELTDSSEKFHELYESIEAFQKSIYDFNKISPENNTFIKRSNLLISKLLTDKKTEFDETLLKSLFVKQPLFPTLKTIINSYYSKDKSLHIRSDISMIPFRKLIWDAQFQNALDYVELTNGNDRYINFKKSKMISIFKYFGGSTIGLIATLHAMVTIFYPNLIDAGAGGTAFGIYGIYACIVTYIVNCGFLAGLAFSSKGLENGNLMFKQSTMPHDWYLKVDQMKMCSKIVEADAEINGLDGFATRDVVSRIQKMGFEVNEPEQEVILRQYWYSSGEGFKWVEPDIDPAEVEWWKHLDDIGVKKVWDQDYSKIEETSADASNETVDGDNDPELLIPGNKN